MMDIALGPHIGLFLPNLFHNDFILLLIFNLLYIQLLDIYANIEIKAKYFDVI